MLYLSEADITPLLSMSDALDAVERALRSQASGEAQFPLRNVTVGSAGIIAAMPGVIAEQSGALGAKLVTVFPNNARNQLHTHQAIIALFDTATGTPRAILDGRYITEIRTAAVSALATRTLAVGPSSIAAIIGTGVQARAHAHALALVMNLNELRICGRNRLAAEALARELRDGGIPTRAVDGVDEACRNASVICTVTASAEPVLASEDVMRGAHINAVGACTPRAREIPADLMAQATIFVDSIEGALSEAGDIMLAMRESALPEQPRLTLLADVLIGRAMGRASPDEITLFESLGIAVEDLACAALVYDRAQARGIGTTIKF